MAAKTKLVMQVGSKPESEYPLDAEVIRLGREHARTIPLLDVQVSRQHAEITCRVENEEEAKVTDWEISDLGSTNGTYINDQRLTGKRPLRLGDRIRLGSTIFTFEEIESGRRFKNFIAVLIALSTLVGAFIAWRISSSLDDANDVQLEGMARLIAYSQAKSETATSMYSVQAAFNDYHWQTMLFEMTAPNLEEDRIEGSQLAYGWMANVNLNYTDVDYIQKANQRTDEVFLAQKYSEEQMASNAARDDMDYTSTFNREDHLRQIGEDLTLTMVFLSLSVLFYTWAEISKSGWKFIAASLGIIFFLAAASVAGVVLGAEWLRG